MANSLTTPVAFIIFNRPERTARVFAAIRAARPAQLFVIADGPRPEVVGDKEKCAATRSIVEAVDWPCEVLHRFASENIGLRRNVAEGLDWLFDQIERGIILEDDCLPDPTFFRFCDELLERFAKDRQVAAIGGSNLDPVINVPPNEESYYFSRFCHIWGWATWRRAWQLCDQGLSEWPALRRTDWLKSNSLTTSGQNYWLRMFDDSHTPRTGGLDTWDVAWLFSCWRHGMLSVVPRVNLVTNIGFGIDAAHTRSQSRSANMPSAPIEFPLRHPIQVTASASADHHIQETFLQGGTLWQRLYWKLRLPLPIWLVRRVRRWLGG